MALSDAQIEKHKEIGWRVGAGASSSPEDQIQEVLDRTTAETR